MVPCHTPLYTLISMYLWGGFVSSQCFFPDGTPTGGWNYSPCNSTTGGQASSCCQLSSSTCTTTGLCYGYGYAYRGACTDAKFPSPCAHNCLDVSTSLYSTIFPCGLYTNSFCCGNMSSSTSHSSTDCCNQSFTGIDFGRPFVPLSYAEAHAEASSSTTSSSSTSSSSFTPSSSSASTITGNAPTTSPPSAIRATPLPINQSSSSSSSHSAAIGAGVGVPLGVALLLGLGFLFYREHKQRLKLESLVRDNLPREKHHKLSQAGAMDRMPHEPGGNYRHEPDGNYRHELGGNYGRELDSNPIYEANETS